MRYDSNQACSFVESLLAEIREYLEVKDGKWEIRFEEDLGYLHYRLDFKKDNIVASSLLQIEDWDGLDVLSHKVMEATTNSIKAIKFKEKIDEERCNVRP